jgi:outer membrane protein assembly complex protein YaeT
VTVEGLDKDTASRLKNGLALAQSSGLLGGKKAVFFPQTLDDDIRRGRLFLARRGYPYSEIHVRFEPNEKKRELGVILNIRPGPPVRVASVILDGVPEGFEGETTDAVSVLRDSVFIDSQVDATVQSLAILLRKGGYARAEVDTRVEWRDTTHVEVLFRAMPGSICYFGETVVSGVDEDIVPLAKRVIEARRGERYDPVVLEDSQKNLRVLGLFRQIRLDLRETAPDTLSIAADLSMRESQRLEAGVRYQTDEELDLAFRWTHRNLFKGGRGGAVLMSASTLLQRAEFSAWWPAVWFARSRLSGTVGARRENEESYEQTTTGFDAAFAYEWSLVTKMRWGIVLSDVKVNEKTPEADVIIEQDGFLAATTLSWEQDRTDSPVVSTRGTYVRIALDWAPNVEISDYRYVILEATASGYTRLPGTRKGVVALRLAGGVAEPRGSSTDIMPSKRFYSGGASSMRGFNRRKLGPLDSAGAPIGGEAKFEGSTEVRFPLFWRLRGTGFLDAGQVWPTIDDVTASNIEFAVGSGIWLDTVIGPLRADAAYRLTTHEKTQPRWVFHFSIGPAF